MIWDEEQARVFSFFAFGSAPPKTCIESYIVSEIIIYSTYYYRGDYNTQQFFGGL